MSLVRLDRRPSRHKLAGFAITWLVFFAAVGALILVRSGSLSAALAVWAMALGVPAAGWISPGFLRTVYLGMLCLTFPIGLVVSHAVLAVIYYFVLTPIGLAARLVGYDPMQRRFDPGAASYWIPRRGDEDIDRHFRQF